MQHGVVWEWGCQRVWCWDVKSGCGGSREPLLGAVEITTVGSGAVMQGGNQRRRVDLFQHRQLNVLDVVGPRLLQ